MLIVSPRLPELTLHRRGDVGWTVTKAGSGGVLELASIPGRITVDDVYSGGLEDAG